MHKRKHSHRRGLIAERVALLYLMLKGYLPLAQRYKTPVGEIDLIMRRGGTLAFVEVKARAERRTAAEAVHAQNQSRVVRAAQYYLATRPQLHALQVRFDVVLLAWYKRPHHLTNAFSGV